MSTSTCVRGSEIDCQGMPDAAICDPMSCRHMQQPSSAFDMVGPVHVGTLLVTLVVIAILSGCDDTHRQEAANADGLALSSTVDQQTKNEGAERNTFGTEDSFLRELLTDPVFGSLNRSIRSKIGSSLTRDELVSKIAQLNELAKMAKMDGSDVLRMFERAVAYSASKGLDPVDALDAVSGSIAFRLASEKQN